MKKFLLVNIYEIGFSIAYLKLPRAEARVDGLKHYII